MSIFVAMYLSGWTATKLAKACGHQSLSDLLCIIEQRRYAQRQLQGEAAVSGGGVGDDGGGLKSTIIDKAGMSPILGM